MADTGTITWLLVNHRSIRINSWLTEIQDSEFAIRLRPLGTTTRQEGYAETCGKFKTANSP